MPRKLADKAIIVASSNNGAVRNIVNELPLFPQLPQDHPLRSKLQKANYFPEIQPSAIANKQKEAGEEILSPDFWGLISIQGGNSTNMTLLMECINRIQKELEVASGGSTRQSLQSFEALYAELSQNRAAHQSLADQLAIVAETQAKLQQHHATCKVERKKRQQSCDNLMAELTQRISLLESEMPSLRARLEKVDAGVLEVKEQLAAEQSILQATMIQRPSFLWIKKMLKNAEVSDYLAQLAAASNVVRAAQERYKELLNKQKQLQQQMAQLSQEQESLVQGKHSEQAALQAWVEKQEQVAKRYRTIITEQSLAFVGKEEQLPDFFTAYDEMQRANYWFDDAYRTKQIDLFIESLVVRKAFLIANAKHFKSAFKIWQTYDHQYPTAVYQHAWEWIHFAIPVISSTFASFGTMFSRIGANSIGNLFIDEAGQAVPQAAVGAIMRSKRVCVVGDPAQIKPVVTLGPKVLEIIRRKYEVPHAYVSMNASVQTLFDSVTSMGYQKSPDKWIGIPLWVHRRCGKSIFDIANKIAYDGKMVFGSGAEDLGIAKWIDVSGTASNKYVKEQKDALKALIEQKIKENPANKDKIFVITPFSYVAGKLRKELPSSLLENQGSKIGTVHTFQGKEADIVFFVLGADETNKGAAKWAVGEPNIVNVAATRAKKELYIIGCKKLYGSLGSEVASETLRLVE